MKKKTSQIDQISNFQDELKLMQARLEAIEIFKKNISKIETVYELNNQKIQSVSGGIVFWLMEGMYCQLVIEIRSWKAKVFGKKSTFSDAKNREINQDISKFEDLENSLKNEFLKFDNKRNDFAHPHERPNVNLQYNLEPVRNALKILAEGMHLLHPTQRFAYDKNPLGQEQELILRDLADIAVFGNIDTLCELYGVKEALELANPSDFFQFRANYFRNITHSF